MLNRDRKGSGATASQISIKPSNRQWVQSAAAAAGLVKSQRNAQVSVTPTSHRREANTQATPNRVSIANLTTHPIPLGNPLVRSALLMVILKRALKNFTHLQDLQFCVLCFALRSIDAYLNGPNIWQYDRESETLCPVYSSPALLLYPPSVVARQQTCW